MAAESFEEVMRHSREMLEKLDRLNKDHEFQKELQEEFAFMNTPEYEIKLAEEFFESTYKGLLHFGGGCMETADEYKQELESIGRWKKEYEPAYDEICDYYHKYEKHRKSRKSQYIP